ncbi:hypothetical protein [Acutalibacter caecimuris]|uniref:hypothetical protein n=1 Tax=Acutalibacter caecimuris TaxID=3093657 RepID=UPI002AC8DF63|nr:hypothetical protein [Acutalibacter sp. M00118]
MAEHWAAALAGAMRGLAGGDSGQGLLFARINSPSPLSIQVNGQTISRHLYRNYGYTPQAGDQVLALRQGDAFYILMKVVPA